MKNKASTEQGKTVSKISCEIRCLDPAAVEAAMRLLDADGMALVPYTCQISGDREEILLLGTRLATRLAARLAETLPEAGDAAGARILAGLYASELCECDVATLTRLPEHEVVDRLRAFSESGVLAHRMLHGMHYFRLDSDDAHRAIAALLPH